MTPPAPSYEAVIGLEVHAQLLTRSKLFCGCSTRFGAEPNTQTCPVCLGMPGVLPVLNRQAVEFAIRTALAVQGHIAPVCRFARKNYFYPDLPKGYQISQYELPLCQGGSIAIEADDGMVRPIGLVRIHMEEDAGKLFHGENLGDPDSSYVDFNRTGVPLLEIVSQPELRTPQEARQYLIKLRSILLYLGVCDGNMEEGSFRCDANISLRPVGGTGLGTKAEVKNMNSFRHVQRALEYESLRQQELLLRGEPIRQETRLWDAERGVTVSMRSKEEAHDYRYFPEPDLVPLQIDQAWIERVHSTMPELPDARRARLVSQYGLPAYDAGVLTSSKGLADYYEACVALYPQPKVVSNWVMGELLRELKREEREVRAMEDCPLPPQRLAGMLRLLEDGVISGKLAKEVFEEMYRGGRGATEIVRDRGLTQITDAAELEGVIAAVMQAHGAEVAAYQGGREKLFGFFVGEVMKATRGKANPQLVNQLLRQKLGRSG